MENRLGTVLSRGFEINGDRALLARSIKHFEASIDRYPTDAPGRTEPMNNLAIALRGLARLDRSSDPDGAAEHLAKGLAIMRELIATPGEPPVPLAEHQHNLAVFLLDRYDSKRATADLEEAEKMLALALSQQGVQGASRATFLLTKGELERELYLATGDDANAARAAAAYAEASRLRGSMQIALTAARALGSLQSERGDWRAGAEAYRRAVDLAERIFRGLAKRETKEAWLQAVAGLPQAAALALAKVGDAAGAVEVLERTRTMILAERLGLRDADLNALRKAGHSELADRYATALAAWDVPAPDSAAEIKADSALDATVAEIRSTPGFERFLETSVIDDLRALPTERLVIFLAIGAHGGVALFLKAGVTKAVLLRRFDDGDDSLWEALATYAQTYDARRYDFAGWLSGLERLTGWMGENVLGPLIAELQGASSCTLVPTGILSLLPWHAASMEIDGEQVHAGDLLAIAYAPSVRALLAARHPGDQHLSLLAVEEPWPVSQHRLPAASIEVEAISDHFSPVVRLPGKAASVQAVLEGLRNSSCAHFACHGIALPTEPADSYLLMAHDQPLSVQAIAGRHGGSIGAELVVLSACETAVPGALAPDEVVNLPTAFLEQGAAAVIGSLWVTPDTATALLMTRLYWNWREAGHALPEALQEAQRWLRNATNNEIAVWLRSVGPNNNGYRALADTRRDKPPDERPYAHPVYWAAFIYLGQ
jgi:tetratricopeptide (TPR) repeat protein